MPAAAGPNQFDVAVVGAGIVGLGHALAAARRGLRTVVIDREARCIGASVRNFGFITVTGQERGIVWRRTMRTRNIWADIAPRVGIEVLQRGFFLLARRPEAAGVLEAFMATEMGERCSLLRDATARARLPGLAPERLEALLYSPHELRVESRDAIPAFAAYLEHQLGVVFHRQVQVLDVSPPVLTTTAGAIRAEYAVVCPGDDFYTLFSERIAAYGVTRCKLHMLRVQGPSIPAPVMSDLSLVRYAGYSALPEASALREVLQREQPDHLANGIHLIAVQSADGSLVVGDSHHYGPSPDPFQPESVDALIRDEFQQTTGLPTGPTLDRWTGVYASAADLPMVSDTPGPGVRLVIVTSGTGASTGLAIGEETIQDLTGLPSKELPS
jgi:D-hydroxyproline dehydrogenase subunit beta